MRKASLVFAILLLTASLNILWAASPASGTIDPAVFGNLKFRAIGPSNMGGRVAEIVGIPGNPAVIYVATAAGGLLRTTNGGATWEPIFDKQDVLSLGSLAIEPSNPDVIWAGTGEAYPRNTVSFGDGVYRSLDGGKTWQNMGLHDSEHITRIAINPRNPNNVFVSALGHPYGPNTERGVFVTEDGGKTWQKTLYIDDQHGAADLAIDPSNPNIVWATMYYFIRRPWTFTSGDEKGGVFRSVDGGHTWKQVTNGLPKLMGRSGIGISASNPRVVYVMAETKEGTLFRSDDGGEHFRKVNSESRLIGRGLYYARMTVDPTDENRVYAIGMQLSMSEDGGRTFHEIGQRTHGDHHTVWVDPKDPNRVIQGDDGGIYISSDRGATWKFYNNFPMGQYYTIHADNREPFYSVSGGLQDNGSWTGPSRVHDPRGISNAHWVMVSDGDGFYIVNSDKDPNLYLSDSQGGALWRTDLATREQQDPGPQPRRNDGGPTGELKYRFNWNAPIVVSPHDPNTVYFGGNVVFKSTDFGKTWAPISPDLTSNDPTKTGQAGGPVWLENTTAEYYETVISLAESPQRAGTIWAGTDDGRLQVTTDGGKNWKDIMASVRGVPATAEVSRIEFSHSNADEVFVSFENHNFDDFRPYIFKTTDGGKSWTNISGNLPAKDYVWCVKQDPKNSNLLYAGTELGLFVSFTGGNQWEKFRLGNLPPVAVRDVTVHPRENDLIVSTHGRSVQIFDDATALQEITPEIVNSDFHLFGTRPAMRVGQLGVDIGPGDGAYYGPNPPYGALITYYLKEKPDAKAPIKLEVLDERGQVIREIKDFPKDKGLNRASWDLRVEGPKPRRDPNPEEDRPQSFFFRAPGGPQVLPGTYKVRMTVNGKTEEKPLTVRIDPTLQVTRAELQEQYDMGIRLRDMMNGDSSALRSLDSVKAQLTTLQSTLHSLAPEAPKEVPEAVSGHLKELDGLLGKMVKPEGVPPYSMGPRLSERVAGLFFQTQSSNSAPTQAQRDLFRELSSEYQQQMAAVNHWTTDSLSALNKLLQQNNIMVSVWAGKPIPTERTESVGSGK